MANHAFLYHFGAATCKLNDLHMPNLIDATPCHTHTWPERPPASYKGQVWDAYRHLWERYRHNRITITITPYTSRPPDGLTCSEHRV